LGPERLKIWRALDWPNRISFIRLTLVAPFVVLLMNQHQWAPARHLALAIFVVMGLSDYLDGVLARRLNAKTRLGAILDPLADKTMVIFSVLLLARAESAVPGARLPNWVVVAVVGKDLWVIVGFIVVYLVTDRFRVQPTRAGKAATFGQVVMVASVLISPDLDAATGSYRVGAALRYSSCWAVVVLSVASVISYTRLGLRFVVAEEKPLEDGGPRGKAAA